MDERLYAEIQNNEIIMESFREMALSQDGQDRIKFVSIATEAVANPSKQANLLNKLFKEVQKVESIDFGRIPDSKGDLTKYQYYDQLYDCIELLNKLTDGKPTPNITTMNKLHQILLDACNDFTFGYRTNNFVIINMYNLMVTSLYEMINVCIVDATEYLRAKLSMSISEMTAKQTRWVTKIANQYIKMYEDGQWNLLMKSFRSAGHTMIATESNGPDMPWQVGVIKKGIDALPNLKETPGKIMSILKDKVPMPGKIIGALIAVFLIMRGAIYLFFAGAGKISTMLKNNANILRSAISVENDKNSSEVEKQKKLLSNLEKVSDVIDYKILKTEKAAANEMKRADREEFNPQEISNISGLDFEL